MDNTGRCLGVHSEKAWGSLPFPTGLTLCVVCVSGMCRHVREAQEDTGFVLSIPEVIAMPGFLYGFWGFKSGFYV